jgi:hypothetical protein
MSIKTPEWKFGSRSSSSQSVSNNPITKSGPIDLCEIYGKENYELKLIKKKDNIDQIYEKVFCSLRSLRRDLMTFI